MVDQWTEHFEAFVGEMRDIIVSRGTQYNRTNDRQENFDNIAAGWSALLGMQVTARQVALCMIWLKLAREVAGAKHDSMLDITNYALIADFSN